MDLLLRFSAAHAEGDAFFVLLNLVGKIFVVEAVVNGAVTKYEVVFEV